MSKNTTEGAIDFACYVDGYISNTSTIQCQI